jgi:hypothetical protein
VVACDECFQGIQAEWDERWADYYRQVAFAGVAPRDRPE